MILRTQISPFAKNISIEEIQQTAFPYNKTALGEIVAIALKGKLHRHTEPAIMVGSRILLF
jgi:hypothetical protein